MTSWATPTLMSLTLARMIELRFQSMLASTRAAAHPLSASWRATAPERGEYTDVGGASRLTAADCCAAVTHAAAHPLSASR